MMHANKNRTTRDKDLQRAGQQILMVYPNGENSWAAIGEFSDYLWDSLSVRLVAYGFTVIGLRGNSVEKLKTEDLFAVVINVSYRSVNGAAALIDEIRKKSVAIPIVLTGNAGLELALKYEKDSAIRFAIIDDIPEILGTQRFKKDDCNNSCPDLTWWVNDDPVAGNLRKAFFQDVAEIRATRGCNHRCSFCGSEMYAPGRKIPWTPRRPENVVSEIEKIVAPGNVSGIQFIDDNFLGSPEKSPQWARDFSHLMTRRFPEGKIRFSIFARLDDTTLEVLPCLKAAGLTQIHAGIESASNSVLMRLNKGIDRRQIEKAIHAIRSMNVQLVVSFIPFELRTSPEELQETIDWIREWNLQEFFSPTPSIPIAGTDLSRELKDKFSSLVSSWNLYGHVDREHFIPYFTYSKTRRAYEKACEFEKDNAIEIGALMKRRFAREALFRREISGTERDDKGKLVAMREDEMRIILEAAQ